MTCIQVPLISPGRARKKISSIFSIYLSIYLFIYLFTYHFIYHLPLPFHLPFSFTNMGGLTGGKPREGNLCNILYSCTSPVTTVSGMVCLYLFENGVETSQNEVLLFSLPRCEIR